MIRQQDQISSVKNLKIVTLRLQQTFSYARCIKALYQRATYTFSLVSTPRLLGRVSRVEGEGDDAGTFFPRLLISSTWFLFRVCTLARKLD